MPLPPLSRRHVLVAAALAPSLVAAQSVDTLRQRLDLPKGKSQIVIDTDTYNEIDDQYAVAYALLSPAQIEVEAIYAAPYLNDRSTSPADGMQKSYDEILRLLKMLRHDPANYVYRGSDTFMKATGQPVESTAARDLIAKAKKPRSQPLYVATIGAPTNVASALLLDPSIKDKIVVLWLGGTPHYWPSAREFNLQQDLYASQTLFDSGVPLVQVPTKNVSEHLRTTLPEMERFLKGRSPLCDYLYDQFVAYYSKYTSGKTQPYPWSKVIWDISTIAWLIQPNWLPSRLVPSPILTPQFTWTEKPGRHVIRVATDANRDAIFSDLFQKLAAAKT